MNKRILAYAVIILSVMILTQNSFAETQKEMVERGKILVERYRRQLDERMERSRRNTYDTPEGIYVPKSMPFFDAMPSRNNWLEQTLTTDDAHTYMPLEQQYIPAPSGLFYAPDTGSYTTSPNIHVAPHVDPHVLPHTVPHIAPHWEPHVLPHLVPHMHR